MSGTLKKSKMQSTSMNITIEGIQDDLSVTKDKDDYFFIDVKYGDRMIIGRTQIFLSEENDVVYTFTPTIRKGLGVVGNSSRALVVLSDEPRDDITLIFGPIYFSVSPTSVTFTTSNWHRPKTITFRRENRENPYDPPVENFFVYGSGIVTIDATSSDPSFIEGIHGPGTIGTRVYPVYDDADIDSEYPVEGSSLNDAMEKINQLLEDDSVGGFFKIITNGSGIDRFEIATFDGQSFLPDSRAINWRVGMSENVIAWADNACVKISTQRGGLDDYTKSAYTGRSTVGGGAKVAVYGTDIPMHTDQFEEKVNIKVISDCK